MTGFHFRYHPVLQDIKRVIQAGTLGKVYYAKAHWGGEYLPTGIPGKTIAKPTPRALIWEAGGC